MAKRLLVTQFSISYDTNYGISRRSGWTSVVNGRTGVQFVSFWAALFDGLKTIFFNEWDDDD